QRLRDLVAAEPRRGKGGGQEADHHGREQGEPQGCLNRGAVALRYPGCRACEIRGFTAPLHRPYICFYQRRTPPSLGLSGGSLPPQFRGDCVRVSTSLVG